MGKEWIGGVCKHRSTRTTITESGDDVITTVTCTDECGQVIEQVTENKTD